MKAAWYETHGVPEPLFLIASREQLVKFLLFGDFRFLFGIARPIVLYNKTENPICFQERHDILELVVDAARCLFLLVSQEGVKLESVFAFNFVKV
jgi:hypothetical protein